MHEEFCKVFYYRLGKCTYSVWIMSLMIKLACQAEVAIKGVLVTVPPIINLVHTVAIPHA